jgi:hypothetical protein
LSPAKLSPTANCRRQIVAVLQHWTPVKIELHLQKNCCRFTAELRLQKIVAKKCKNHMAKIINVENIN